MNLDKFGLAYPLKTVKFKIFAAATPPAADGPPPKYFLHLVYVKRYHYVDFQPNRTMLGRPSSSPPKNLIKSPSSIKIVGAPPAPDGSPPKYVLQLVYVRRYHHIDF